MTDITNSIGDIITVTDTIQQIDFVTAAEGNTHKSALQLMVTNTGSSVIYVTVNELSTTFDITKAAPISPAENNPVRWWLGQPIKRMCIACASGETSSAVNFAY